MKLQISSRIAIFALLELAARPHQQVSVAEVGEKYGISSHHLAKVMHTLTRAGLVRSVRGAGGGYVFTGHVRRITLLDVISLFENIGAGDGDAAGQTAEERALGQILREIDDIAGATLGSVTLATVLKLVERRRPAGRGARAAART
jgi:Rrf2 family protein